MLVYFGDIEKADATIDFDADALEDAMDKARKIVSAGEIIRSAGNKVRVWHSDKVRSWEIIGDAPTVGIATSGKAAPPGLPGGFTPRR